MAVIGCPKNYNPSSKSLNKASNQIERQQERLLEAYIANIIQLPEFERKRKELIQKQEALYKQENQLQAKSTQMFTLAQIAESI